MERICIYGVGGFALQIIDMVHNLAENGAEISFICDGADGEFLGYPMIGFEGADPTRARIAIAIANGATRKRLAEHAVGFDFVSIVARSAIISRHAHIGSGAIICDNTIIEASTRIGKHFHANIYSYVAHESVIGDYVTFAPRVSCNGNVRIGDGAYVGAGAIIKQGTPDRPLVIGAGAVIGMGAVVTKDVPAGAVVMGNPARITTHPSL